MAEAVSIWRWVVMEGLEDLFARLIAADDAGFAVIAQEMAVADAPADPDQIFADAEAKVRAMGLPEADLVTTLAGLRAMREEALADDAADDDSAPDPDGKVGIALASSHMFFDDPFASLEYQEIARQVSVAMEGYRSAIGKITGHQGQSMGTYLGLEASRLYEDAAFDLLMESGLAEVEWLWVIEDQVLYLSHWQEDKELPIDLEFGRAPLMVFEAVRARIRESHEM